MKDKLEDIKHIQNTLWSIYKDFLKDHDVCMFTNKAAELVSEYEDKCDMKLFCQDLIITWTPVINGMAAEFRKESVCGK